MDKLSKYREYIKDLIKKHSYKSAYGNVEIQNIFDTENEHYQLVHAGWFNDVREYGCIIHVDIKDGKIWIQQDGTESGVADELVEAGVPNEDIVLAYQPPYKRAYSGFAIGS